MKITSVGCGSPFFTTDKPFPDNFIYYTDFVKKLAKPMESEILDALHGAVGISGEAGELLDAIKKVWVYNKPMDRKNVVEELGDLRFYMQHLMNVLGITETEVIEANVQKLHVRYAAGYSDAAAQARADKEPEAAVESAPFDCGFANCTICAEAKGSQAAPSSSQEAPE